MKTEFSADDAAIIIDYIGDMACSSPEQVVLVEHDEDYVRACRKLSGLHAPAAGLKVWVRSKNHFVWLKDFTKQIDCSARFSEKTPRRVLAEKWNVVLPDWLTDAAVLDQGLLNADIEPQAEQTSFSNRLLAHFLGPAFKKDDFNTTVLVDVIEALVSTEKKAAFEQYPVLHRSLEFKCDSWVQRGKEAWVKNLCSRLCADSSTIWQWLSLWACLHGYPKKLLEYVLAPEQALLVADIPVAALDDLPLAPDAKEQVLTQVELLFKEIQPQVTSSEEFQKVLGWTSGRLLQEYQFISSILRSRQFSPSTRDVEQVQARFRYCPGVRESSLNALRYCVAPSRPGLIDPQETWDSTAWLRWTTEEYMPYRTWQIHNNHCDEELEKTVVCFSDWFIEEYTAVHKNPDLSLIHCLAGLAFDAPQKQLSIVLLVDCLPLEFAGLLDHALRNVGYSRHDLRYRFAALPTVTEYNKPALISGQWQAAAGNYDAILKARAQSDGNNSKIIYLYSIKMLSELPTPPGSAVILLNCLDGDELLHTDVESQGASYDEELSRLFARMAEGVSRISQEWAGPKEHVSVYVVTDHGACRILEEEKQTFDSAVVRKLFPNEKHRFAALDEKQAGDVPGSLWALGYRFTQPFGPSNKTFFLPRGHNTVKMSGKARGYMHGGVTPEEVVVPTALYKLVKAAWKAPVARFLNLELIKETGRAKFFIQRVVTLNLELQNSNTLDLRVLRATVVSPETDLKSCNLGIIPAQSVKPIQMNCYFKKAALGEGNLEIEIDYDISGEQHTLSIVLECIFKSAMAGGLNLREL